MKFSGTVTRVIQNDDGTPQKTETLQCSGYRDDTRFVFNLGPSSDQFKLMTSVGWDGSLLRCVETISNAGALNGTNNQMDDGTDVRAFIDNAPIPRTASRSAQALAFGLVSDSVLHSAALDGKNWIRIDDRVDIPEELSRIEIIKRPELGADTIVLAHATNFAWDTRTGKKKRFDFSGILTNGFLHWSVSRHDALTGRDCYSTIDFRIFYYNLESGKSGRGEIPVSSTTARLQYELVTNREPPGGWMPVLPKDGLWVSDFRTAREVERMPEVTDLTCLRWKATNQSWGLQIVQEEEAKQRMVKQLMLSK